MTRPWIEDESAFRADRKNGSGRSRETSATDAKVADDYQPQIEASRDPQGADPGHKVSVNSRLIATDPAEPTSVLA